MVIKKLICAYDNAISIKYVNKKNRRRLWGTQKNIEAAGKWAQKNEEQEKKTRKDNLTILLNDKYIFSYIKIKKICFSTFLSTYHRAIRFIILS